MPVCAKVVVVDGQSFLALDPVETNLASCAYLIEDGSSYSANQLTNLSAEQAGEIAVAVGVVWAIAWCYKQLMRTIDLPEN